MKPVVHPARSAASPALEVDAAQRWLGAFETALHDGDRQTLAALFSPDSHWRDLLAFTWNITPHSSPVRIAEALCVAQHATRACGFTLAEGRTPPRRVRRLGVEVIEAIFKFETASGQGVGVVRLLADAPSRA